MHARALILTLVAACGTTTFGPNAGSEACRDACSTQADACTDFDEDGCNVVCDAYEITEDTTACIDALEAWQSCLADQTYSCFDDLAVPDDVDACKGLSDAFFDC